MGGPIPLHRYRRFKNTAYEKRAERIEALAEQLRPPTRGGRRPLSCRPAGGGTAPWSALRDPDPFHEFTYPSALKAKQAIADELVMPLAKLPREQLDALDALLAHTLRKSDVLDYVRRHLKPLVRGC